MSVKKFSRRHRPSKNSRGTSAESVHLGLPYLITAIVDKDWRRPKCCNDQVIAKTINFMVLPFALLPFIFSRLCEHKQFLPVCIDCQCIGTSDLGDDA